MECILLLMMGWEEGLCQGIEHGIHNWKEAAKPFCGVAFALRGAGLFGLERDGVRQDEGGEIRTVSQGFDLQVP